MQDIVNTDEMKAKIESAVKDISSSAELREIKMKFLGKNGEIPSLMKGLKDLPSEERPAAGKVINALREWAEDAFGKCEERIKNAELNARYEREKIDVTMPGKRRKKGAFHPDTLVVDELVSVFSGKALYIPVIGIMFVISGISVMIQVIYYKRTRRRIFLMAPVHHHFQMKGFAESKISYAYFAVTAVAGLLCLVFA